MAITTTIAATSPTVVAAVAQQTYDKWTVDNFVLQRNADGTWTATVRIVKCLNNSGTLVFNGENRSWSYPDVFGAASTSTTLTTLLTRLLADIAADGTAQGLI